MIENEEILYRPDNRGGYQSRSFKFCSRCVGQHDQIQNAKKVMTRVAIGVAVVALLVATVYLLYPR